MGYLVTHDVMAPDVMEWVHVLSSECKVALLLIDTQTCRVLHGNAAAYRLFHLSVPTPFDVSELNHSQLIQFINDGMPIDMTLDFPLRNMRSGTFHVKIRRVGPDESPYLTVVGTPMSAAADMNVARDSFLRLVSHELRTPLTSIIGYLDLLKRGAKGALTDRQQDLCGVALTEAHSLKFLIDDVLQLSQLLSGTLILQYSDFDLKGAIEQVVELVLPSATAKALNLRVECPDGPLMIQADYQKVVRMLSNLANNAIKFTQKGEVLIKGFETPQWLELHVCDTGRGMNHMQLSDIYTQFKQSECAWTSQVEGLGLGLSIVKRLVELHAGQIWVKSMMGAGSTFCVRLPKSKP